MGKTGRALMVIGDGKDRREILTLAGMCNQMQSGWVQFTTTKTMTEVRRYLRTRSGCFEVTRWDRRAFWWHGAGNPTHGRRVSFAT